MFVSNLVLRTALIGAAITTQVAYASPNTIAYNGKLIGKDGVPVKGTQTMEFTLCDQLVDGTCPWKEQRSVTFNNGVFSIRLGEVTPLPPSIFSGKPLFLGASMLVSGTAWEVFSPRRSLAAAPFAINANDVLDRDISPKSVSIAGVGKVIDSSGKWVGSSSGLQGPQGPQGPAGPAGATGSAGPKGDPGQTSLISLVNEPAGGNCAAGGKKVLVGIDSNGNGALDASEATSSAFVCNGVSDSSRGTTANRSTLSYSWTQAFGSSSTDDVKDIAIDAEGNIYVTGSYTSSFDNLQHFGGVDTFVRKYSPQGQALWTKGFGGSGKDVATAIAVDSTNNAVYLAGVFSSPSITFATATNAQAVLNRTNTRQSFVLRLDKEGNFSWVKTIAANDSRGEGGITDITTDESGNVYYCGTVGSTILTPPVAFDFNPDASVNDTRFTQGRADMFVSMLDKNGFYQWTNLEGTQKNYRTATRIIAKGGTVYVVGKDKAYNTILLRKLSPLTGQKVGEGTWVASNFPYLAPSGIAVDSKGGIVVSAIGSIYKGYGTGSSLGDLNMLRSVLGGQSIFPSIYESFTIIQKFDVNLVPQWTHTQGAFGFNGAYAVALDASDNVYFGGEYTGDLVNSESTVYDARASVGGSTDINLVKLSSSGMFQWAETFGGYGRDRIQGIAIHGNDVYIGGFLSGGMDVNFTRTTRSYISSRGAEDGFLGKYSGLVTP